MTPSAPQQALPQLPTPSPTPPVFGNMPSKKPATKSQTATFLGAADIGNPTDSSQKKLVGQ